MEKYGEYVNVWRTLWGAWQFNNYKNLLESILNNLTCCWQALSQGTGGTAADLIGLDVHAISDLQNRGVPTTDDAPKYKYQATENGKYCKHVSK